MLENELMFLKRTFPSANQVLVKGTAPILIDSGFGSDFADTIALLRSAGVRPEALQMVANTHYHCDHAGGNHHFQREYDIAIAAHALDAAMINQRDRETCSVEWLSQVIEPYSVTRALLPGDVLDTGNVQLEVLHTPGHTLNHLSFYVDGYLICGDTFHHDDVAWLNVFREGAGAIYRIMQTLDELAKLPLKQSLSGHGVVSDDPLSAIDRARRRYEKWLTQPEKIAWHASKRILTYALMLHDGMTRAQLEHYLLHDSPWYLDYCRYVFDAEPADFVQPMLAELLRSGAAYWHNDGRLLPGAAYNAPPAGWLNTVPAPTDWPPALENP